MAVCVTNAGLCEKPATAIKIGRLKCLKCVKSSKCGTF